MQRRLLRLIDDAWLGLPALVLFALLFAGPARVVIDYA
jgi:hypothetical protein